MRNILIGLVFGISVTAGFSVVASSKGPTLRGESGRLGYAIVVEGVVECTDPWVSIPERMIECDSEPPDGDFGPNRALIARSTQFKGGDAGPRQNFSSPARSERTDR